MFIRAVWRDKSLIEVRQSTRKSGLPTRRSIEILGVSAPDFVKMTQALFDR
jgi:hypothetical protein